MKKAVFFDIDGTIWDEHSVIPESTVQGIRKLRAKGHLAFLCSGRSRAFIQAEHLLEIGFDGIIAGCGTYIEDADGKILFYKKLDNSQVAETLEILRQHRMPAILEGREFLYYDREEFNDTFYGQKLEREMGEHLHSIQKEEGKWEISKMSASLVDCVDFEDALKKMSSWYDPLVHEGMAVEFVPKGFSKASGIQKTCELYGIDHEDTFAFGDSINDVEMLKYVHTGIAMGNCTPPAREAADYVTDQLQEDGIYHALEHFGLI